MRSVGATRSVWARGIAGASPAALTILELLPWSNTSGIRLLNGTMQVGILPAAPIQRLQVAELQVAGWAGFARGMATFNLQLETCNPIQCQVVSK